MIDNNIKEEKDKNTMNTLLYRDPITNMFREIEALLDFDFSKNSKGLKRLISRPHNLLTHKDEQGNVVSYEMQLVYTPFKKADVHVSVVDSVLIVQCGCENKDKDEAMDFCGISHQSFEFKLPLSEQVDTVNITAKAEDGMLYIELPVKKVEEEKKAQVIEIQ